ncbi:cupin domain-containing protein [Fibrobacterota bacterium]
MTKLIERPTAIKACGTKEKIIREFVGMVNSRISAVSIAKMESPQGWEEPGQTPEFDEYSIVIKGTLRVETRERVYEVKAGQAIMAEKNEWVRYSTPHKEGAEYVAVCLPAFNPELVHRDTA